MRSTLFRTLALVATLLLVLAACDPEETDPDEPDPEAPEETDEEVPEAADPEDPEATFATYEMGIFEDLEHESYWSYLDDTDVWSGYVMSGSGAACQLYSLSAPNFAVTPQLATADWEPAEQDGDVWFVEIEIHEGINWSDGEPITANDMEFTWETVVDMPLAGQWLANYEPEPLDAGNVTDVIAVDDTTVRVEFAEEPGLGTWPMQVALAPIMPEHHWGPIVEEADDPETLLAESGIGSPSCGPFVFDDREEGAFASMSANEEYFLTGTSYTHYDDGTVHMVNEELGIDDTFGEASDGDGEVLAEYTQGPYAEDVIFTLYGDASVAVTALVEGEIPFLLTGPGIEEAAQDEIFDSEDVEAVVNPDYGMQYLGFNFQREPMDDQAFRQAVATVVDREHITDTLMGGSALPLTTLMPAGNEAWYDEERGDPLAEQWDHESMADRVEAATEILADAGYTWESEPDVDDEGEVVPGEGIMDPDGETVPTLELAHPTAGYDPLRHTAGMFIGESIEHLGFDVDAAATEFQQLVDMTSPPDDLGYDMIILGWSLGNPAMPTYYDTFFRSDSATNNTGFASDEYDEAVQAFMTADDLGEAYEILWDDLEPILQEELPYVPLFDTPNVEGFRHGELQFPYTEVLGGIEFVDGQPALVTEAQ